MLKSVNVTVIFVCHTSRSIAGKDALDAQVNAEQETIMNTKPSRLRCAVYTNAMDFSIDSEASLDV
jgi:hypothetical protein